MDPTTWIIVAVAVGVVLAAVCTLLVRRWNRQNRRRYPDRVSNRFFEINREPRR